MPTDHLGAPARRRRHARLIAALTELIGACSEAAVAVYRTIADAPPGQEAVGVNLMPCIQVSLSAALLLDRAQIEDADRWTDAAEREREQARGTFAARCAVAQAQDLTDPAWPVSEHGVPLPTVEQGAAMDLAGAGNEVAARWRDDPSHAAALVLGLAATGEFTSSEILDEAVSATVVAGLLTLQATRGTSDPTMVAELCLSAVPYIVLAVILASADLD